MVTDALLSAHRAGSAAVPIGFLDDAPHLQGQIRLGLPVFGTLEDIDQVDHQAIVVGIGNNRVRQRVCQEMKQRGERFAAAIHPRSTIAADVQVGEGTLICAGVVVNTGSVIGVSVILNTACSVDHHNQVGDYVHVAPGVHTGGDVTIGAGTLIGIGATVMPQCRVGVWAVVGAGAVVTSDIPSEMTVAGVPAIPDYGAHRFGHRRQNPGAG